MADANVESKFSMIVTAVADLLKPKAFKKRGRTLRRTRHGNLELIEFQRSITSSARVLRFTLNIGVCSSVLAAQAGVDLSNAMSADAHLRRRIGAFLPDPHDKWWDLNAKTEAIEAVKEIAAILTEKVVPYLDDHSADVALVKLWESGHAPGLTDTQRLRYLSALKTAAAQ